MWREGGLYADADTQCLTPFDSILRSSDDAVSGVGHDHHGLEQFVLVYSARHPVIGIALRPHGSMEVQSRTKDAKQPGPIWRNSHRRRRLSPDILRRGSSGAPSHSESSIQRIISLQKQSSMIRPYLNKRDLNVKKKAWYIIRPDSKRLVALDFLDALALLWTAFVVPFEVAFLPVAYTADSALFICNRLVDAVFFVDLALQFFLAYESGLYWVKTHSRIVKHYLKGWFSIDLVSTGVSAFDFMTVGAEEGSADKGNITSWNPHPDLSFVTIIGRRHS